MSLASSGPPEVDALSLVKLVVATFPAFRDESIHPHIGRGKHRSFVTWTITAEQNTLRSQTMEARTNIGCRALGSAVIMCRRLCIPADHRHRCIDDVCRLVRYVLPQSTKR